MATGIDPATWAVSDADLRRIVDSADVPSLLAALAQLTGDRDILDDRCRPPEVTMSATIPPQGGLTAEQVALARASATSVLIDIRDGRRPIDPAATGILDDIVEYLTGRSDHRYRDLLHHEIALTGDAGAPGWHVDDPGRRAVSAVVIGAGLSGIIAGHRLRQAGVDFTILEKNNEVGGTWWENTYPGCRLDTANYAYSFSFAQKPDWPSHFSEQPHIRDYLIDVSRDVRIRDRIRFDTEVVDARWDERACRWTVTLIGSDGTREQIVADAVISCVGQLNQPRIPEIPGMGDFAGDRFHSAQWPADFDPAGKRIAVVGTGASAFQIAPAVAEGAAHLTVFQRSAPWMLPTPHYHAPISDDLQWLFSHLPNYARWYRFWQFWVSVEARLPLVVVDPTWDEPGSVSAANKRLREELESFQVEQYRDRPDLLPHAIPDYPAGVKRMLRDNGDWARMLQRPDVHLETSGIAAADEAGLVTADGEHHDVDAVVFATGFRADEFLHPISVHGRGGETLEDYWGGDARAYATVTVPQFPNLFVILGPNSGLAANGSIIFMTESAVEYTLACLEVISGGQADALEPTAEALDAFCARVDEANRLRAWGIPGERTWYKNAFDRVSQNWPFDLVDYWDLTRAPMLEDYRLLHRSETS
ncbi:hypothetical protein ASD65_10530 [Microbacterium sp. Root61]|nr:hypothetical protein ASD65_10530 [Microbacterium sp. Root61]